MLFLVSFEWYKNIVFITVFKCEFSQAIFTLKSLIFAWIFTIFLIKKLPQFLLRNPLDGQKFMHFYLHPLNDESKAIIAFSAPVFDHYAGILEFSGDFRGSSP